MADKSAGLLNHEIVLTSNGKLVKFIMLDCQSGVIFIFPYASIISFVMV